MCHLPHKESDFFYLYTLVLLKYEWNGACGLFRILKKIQI